MDERDSFGESQNLAIPGAGQLSGKAQNMKLEEQGDAIARISPAAAPMLPHSLSSALLECKEKAWPPWPAPPLPEKAQEELLRTGMAAVQKSLASNRNLSAALMQILAAGDIEDFRAGQQIIAGGVAGAAGRNALGRLMASGQEPLVCYG